MSVCSSERFGRPRQRFRKLVEKFLEEQENARDAPEKLFAKLIVDSHRWQARAGVTEILLFLHCVLYSVRIPYES